jgi:uncharacterized protein (DUF433 family)
MTTTSSAEKSETTPLPFGEVSNKRHVPGGIMQGRREPTNMTREELLSRITINPNVCFGKPCLRGHRIWVSLILDYLASGMTPRELLAEYPGLEEADILACIAYGAEKSAIKNSE